MFSRVSFLLSPFHPHLFLSSPLFPSPSPPPSPSPSPSSSPPPLISPPHLPSSPLPTSSPHLRSSPLPISHRPLHGPLFLLDLVLDEEGAHYSSDLSDFKTTLLSVFDRGILVTHTVPQIEKVQGEIGHQVLHDNNMNPEVCVFISASILPDYNVTHV